MQGAIKPASNERADENGRDDRPSIPPDHRKPAAHRPFPGPQPVLAPTMRPFNGFFQFTLVGPQLVIVMLLLGCHDQRPAVISAAWL